MYKRMKSVASSSKSFKCDCCAYVTSQSNNLSRHKKSKHSESQSKKAADESSDISESESQPILNQNCHFCINYKQLVDMKDNRISELEKQLELLQKDLQIAVLQTKLECKDVVVDLSGNFIDKLSNIIQSQQFSPTSQPKSRPRKTEAVEETNDMPLLALPTIVSTSVLAPKPIKKKALTKEELAIQDYHENMNEIVNNMKKPLPAKPTKPREIDVDYLNETCGNAEPFENLVEHAFKNTKYFEMTNLTEEKLKECKMKKNDYYVTKMVKFQDHMLKPSKSKNALLEYQVDMEGKEKFYNSLFIEAFEKQEVKSFYYLKKTKQSFYKNVDSWKMCDNDYIEKILKRFEDRLFTVAAHSRRLLMIGEIPASCYGYKDINYSILNSGRPRYQMPHNENQLLEDLTNQYSNGLMESCNNERMSDILFKKLKLCFDPKASHNSDVCVKYEKEAEPCESVAAKSDDEEE